MSKLRLTIKAKALQQTDGRMTFLIILMMILERMKIMKRMKILEFSPGQNLIQNLATGSNEEKELEG